MNLHFEQFKNLCIICKKSFGNQANLVKHHKLHRTDSWRFGNVTLPSENAFFSVATAHKKFLQTFQLNNSTEADLETFVTGNKDHLKVLLESVFKLMGPFKMYSTLYLSYTTPLTDRECNGFLSSKMIPVYSLESCDEIAARVTQEILAQGFERSAGTQTGSGWTIHKVDQIFVNVSKFSSWSGGRLHNHTLPKGLASKKALITVKCSSHCFYHCLRQSRIIPLPLSSLANEPSETSIQELPKIEDKFGLAVNVYSWDQVSQGFPVRISNKTDSPVFNVLLYRNHYWYIKNFNRFVGHARTHNRKYCYFCLCGFRSQDILDGHLPLCREKEACRIKLPPPDTKISFTNFKAFLKVPWVVYADFEALLVPQTVDLGNSIRHVVNKHEVFAYGLAVVSQAGDLEEQSRCIITTEGYMSLVVKFIQHLKRIYRRGNASQSS